MQQPANCHHNLSGPLIQPNPEEDHQWTLLQEHARGAEAVISANDIVSQTHQACSNQAVIYGPSNFQFRCMLFVRLGEMAFSITYIYYITLEPNAVGPRAEVLHCLVGRGVPGCMAAYW